MSSAPASTSVTAPSSAAAPETAPATPGEGVWVVDRATGEIFMGEVPPYSVVVSGSLPGKNVPGENWGPSLYCAVIVKRVDEKTRAKTSVNELLRD